MNVIEHLGLNNGRPVTADEGEILGALETLFIDRDFLFLRSGRAITLCSDYGTTVVAVAGTDSFGARLILAMAPRPILPPEQIRHIVSAASAESEAEDPLLIIERPGQPLIIGCEVEVQRPYTWDGLTGVFGDFVLRTDVAIGEAVRRLDERDDAGVFAGSCGCFPALQF